MSEAYENVKPNDDEHDEDKNCTVIAHKKANISVPITVKPRVKTKEANTFCVGEPVVLKKTLECKNQHNPSCSFVLSQNVCIEIPVEIAADAIVREASIDCMVKDEHEHEHEYSPCM